jgi:hypothetical protein
MLLILEKANSTYFVQNDLTAILGRSQFFNDIN